MDASEKKDRLFLNPRNYGGQMKLYLHYVDRGLERLHEHLKDIERVIDNDHPLDLNEEIAKKNK